MKKINFLLTSLFIPVLTISTYAQSTVTFDHKVTYTITAQNTTMDYVVYFGSDGAIGIVPTQANPMMDVKMMLMKKQGDACKMNTYCMVNGQKYVMDLSSVRKKLMAQTGDVSSDKSVSFEKTGKTKMIAGYDATEYKVESSNGTSYIWFVDAGITMNLKCGKTLFKGKMPTNIDANMEAIKGKLMAEVVNEDGKTIMKLISVQPSSKTFNTEGYQPLDMSKMMQMYSGGDSGN